MPEWRDTLLEGRPRRVASPALNFNPGLCPDPSSPEAGKGSCDSLSRWAGFSVNLVSRGFRGITGPLPHYSTVLLTPVPLRIYLVPIPFPVRFT